MRMSQLKSWKKKMQWLTNEENEVVARGHIQWMQKVAKGWW